MKVKTPNKVNHWEDHAIQWDLIKPPLRPGAEDVKLLSGHLADLLSRDKPDTATAILFGVTPEVTTLQWPANVTLLAIDCSAGMIRSVWNGDRTKNQYAVQANWLTTPLPGKSVDIIIADGCFTLLDYPNGYQRLFAEVHRVLKDSGQFNIRFFCKTCSNVTPQIVIDQLIRGEIGNFHIFKFTLAIALQKDAESGVRLGDIWDCWNESGIEADELSVITGWPLEEIRTIDAYKDVNTRYNYPSLDEIRAVFAPLFKELTCDIHDYEFSENCPSLTLASIGSSQS